MLRTGVNWPPATSEGTGEWFSCSVLLAGMNVPCPPLQAPPVAMVTAPLNGTCAMLAQRCTSGPALAVGAGVNWTCTESRAARHPPLPVDARYNQRLPLAISDALGV